MFVGSRKVERDRYVSIASMTHVSSAVFHIRLRHFEINSPLELKNCGFSNAAALSLYRRVHTL